MIFSNGETMLIPTCKKHGHAEGECIFCIREERDALLLQIEDFQRRFISDRTEIEGLKEKLDEYGQHYGQCPMDRSDDGKPGCTCGLDELLKLIEKRNREGDGHVCIAAEFNPCPVCGRKIELSR